MTPQIDDIGQLNQFGESIMKVLHLDSSILGNHSVSRELTQAVVDAYRNGGEQVDVIYRDLGTEPLPHISPDLLAPRGTPVEQMSDAQRRDNEISDLLIDELKTADVVVIGAPLYNFTVPSGLKAWIDRIAVAGKTFSYGANGPIGLVPNKKAVIVATAGGIHSQSPVTHMHDGYVKTVLNFVGVQDVEVVRAEGLNMGPELREKALEAARAQIAELTEPQAA